MQRKKLWIVLILAITALLVISACTTAEPAPAAEPAAAEDSAAEEAPAEAEEAEPEAAEAEAAEPAAETEEQAPAESALPSEDDMIALITEKLDGKHDIDRVLNSDKTREEWEETLDRMIGYGAKINEEEKTLIIDWLLSR